MTNSKGEMMSELPPLKSWQFYAACRSTLGMETLQKLFKRSPTQIYRWGRDPDCCEDVERNPIDRMNFLLERLCEIGREEIAMSAVAMMARTVGCGLSANSAVVPDKTDIDAECLDDYPAVVEFHNAIRDGKSIDTIRYRLDRAKRELDETFAAAKAKR